MGFPGNRYRDQKLRKSWSRDLSFAISRNFLMIRDQRWLFRGISHPTKTHPQCPGYKLIFPKYPRDFAKSQDFQKFPILGDKNPRLKKCPIPRIKIPRVSKVPIPWKKGCSSPEVEKISIPKKIPSQILHTP